MEILGSCDTLLVIKRTFLEGGAASELQCDRSKREREMRTRGGTKKESRQNA